MAQRTYTVQQAADELGVGKQRLFRWLREQRVIDAANLPYSHYRDQGLLRVRYGHWRHPQTGTHTYARPLITQRGLEWLRRRLEEVAA